MQLSTFLLALTALYTTVVSGTCFHTGQNWGDHGIAKAQLANACIELSGHYNSGAVRGNCRKNPKANESYKFEIRNNAGRAIDIGQDECNRNIGAQIDNCGHGGAISVSGVYFRYGRTIKQLSGRRLQRLRVANM